MEKQTVQKLFLCFWMYAILGWCYEVFLEVVVYKWGFTNLGIMYGPYCPIYAVGALLFLLIFNVPALLARYYGLKVGYESGAGFIDSMQKNGTIELLTKCAKILGLCVVGAMIASMVTFTTPLVISVGETSVELQSIFDQILPGILPLALTFGCYALLKKGHRTTSIMFGLIAAGIIGSLIGVL